MALTAQSVANKMPTDKRVEYPDGGNGLFLVVQPSGVKSWAVRYRAPDGARRKVTLGLVLTKRTEPIDGSPAIGAAHTLAEARKAAAAIMGRVAEGHDPAKERAEAKAPKPARTIGPMIERFLKANGQKRSISEMRRRLNGKAVATIHDRPIDDVTKAEIGLLWDDFEGQTEANRTFETLRLFFNWVVGRGIVDQSPMVGLKKPFPDAERQRKRVLSDAELAKVWHAAGDLGEPFGPLVRLLILTGQRRGEVAGLRDSELKGDLWVLPGDRTKNGHDHTVPLTPTALSEIAKVTRIPGEAGLIFTTTGKTPVSGFGRAKDRLDVAVGFTDWTMHDLRRTVATGMQRLRVPLEVTEAALNHIGGSREGIVGIYQTHSYDDEKRDALSLWSHYVQWITDDAALRAFDHVARTSKKRPIEQLKAQHDAALRSSDAVWKRYISKFQRLSRLI